MSSYCTPCASYHSGRPKVREPGKLFPHEYDAIGNELAQRHVDKQARSTGKRQVRLMGK